MFSIRSSTNSATSKVGIAAALVFSLTSMLPVAATDPAQAQTRSAIAAITREDLAAAQARVAPALQAGHHILLVELYGTTLYVFNVNHNVGGPVIRVLELLGFESILPDGVTVDGSGARSLPINALRTADVEHVFFVNFSADQSAVAEVESQLREMSSGRLHRLDTNTGEALSDQWTEDKLLPRISAAFATSSGS